MSNGVTLDGSGNVLVVGSGDAAWGTNPARAYNAGYDAHLVKLSPSDGAVQMLAFVGGEGDDFGSGLAVDGSGTLQWNSFFGGTPWPLYLPLILR